MGTPFSNTVLGGMSKLIRQAIQSPNFVTGSTGWTINKDGSAEFNNVVIRNGTVISGTALYYNGTPALGNLVASIAATGGTDSFGNPYKTGITAYNTVTGNSVNMSGSTITVSISGDTNAAVISPASVFSAIDAIGIQSPGINSTDTIAFLNLIRAAQNTPAIAQFANAVLNMKTNWTAVTPVNGFNLYSALQQPAYVNQQGLQQNLSGAQLTTFPNITVTGVGLTTVGSGTIPASDAQVAGARYELIVKGHGTQGTTQQGVVMQIILGSTAIGLSAQSGSAFCAASQGFRWRAHAVLDCVSTGSGGTWHGDLLFTVTQPSGASNSESIDTGTSVPVAVSTIVSNVFGIQAAWGATTGGPTLTSDTASFRRIA